MVPHVVCSGKFLVALFQVPEFVCLTNWFCVFMRLLTLEHSSTNSFMLSCLSINTCRSGSWHSSSVIWMKSWKCLAIGASSIDNTWYNVAWTAHAIASASPTLSPFLKSSLSVSWAFVATHRYLLLPLCPIHLVVPPQWISPLYNITTSYLPRTWSSQIWWSGVTFNSASSPTYLSSEYHPNTNILFLVNEYSSVYPDHSWSPDLWYSLHIYLSYQISLNSQ